MKKQLFSFVTSISLLTSMSLPVIAQTAPSQPSSSSQQESATLAKNTAIIISFPASMTVDISEKQDLPLTVFLKSAITDNQGNVIAPENTPVSIILKPTNGGLKIIAQSLVVNGKVVFIQASSPKLPGASITHKAGYEKAEENGAIWGKIGQNAVGFATGGKVEDTERGSMLGTTLGLVTGLSSPKKSRVVKINENSIYVLSLDKSVNLSAR